MWFEAGGVIAGWTGLEDVVLGDVLTDVGVARSRLAKLAATRSVSFSVRNRSSPGAQILTSVALSSLTVGVPSSRVTRFLVESSRKISSRNGA